MRLYGEKIEGLQSRYKDKLGEDFIIQTDFSSTDTVYSADLLVTDWSNVGFEFALSTLKPVLYINTPMKIMNPEYDKIDVVPFDIRIRGQLGGELELSQLDRAGGCGNGSAVQTRRVPGDHSDGEGKGDLQPWSWRGGRRTLYCKASGQPQGTGVKITSIFRRN